MIGYYDNGKSQIPVLLVGQTAYVNFLDVQETLNCKRSDIAYYSRLEDLLITNPENKSYWISQEGLDRLIILMPSIENKSYIRKWFETIVIPSAKEDSKIQESDLKRSIEVEPDENKPAKFDWIEFYKTSISTITIFIIVIAIFFVVKMMIGE